MCSRTSPICYRLPGRFTKPSARGVGGAQCRRKVSQETSLAIESLLHASKPFMFPLPSKKGKPHLEVIYLVIAHYLQLISIKAS